MGSGIHDGGKLSFSDVLTLWIHDDSLSSLEVLFNPIFFPEASIGSIIQVSKVRDDEEGSGKVRAVFRRYMFVNNGLDPLYMKKSPNLQVSQSIFACITLIEKISIAKHVAQSFGLTARTAVRLIKVEKKLVEANFVELTFCDQHVDRGEAWRLALSMTNTCVYTSKKIVFAGIRAMVKAVYINGRKSNIAFVSPNKTKPIFRSESSQYVILIQMSKEMWTFEEDGEVMCYKAINGFLSELFRKWEGFKAKHLVTIVLFTRVFYSRNTLPLCNRLNSKSVEDNMGLPPCCTAVTDSNVFYRDFYKIVADNIVSRDMDSILQDLKREFSKFQTDVLIMDEFDSNNTSKVMAGHLSFALQGNVLEAIELSAKRFFVQNDEIDLFRSGNSIVIVSPGSGQFEVDQNLLHITTENIITKGISVDLVCLSKLPLHCVPLLKYHDLKAISKCSIHTETTSPSVQNCTISDMISGKYKGGDGDLSDWIYAVPFWINTSFWCKQTYDKRTSKIKAFTPRCKMHELQMMGIMENELSSIAIPVLPAQAYKNKELLRSWQDDYDERVFNFSIFLRVLAEKGKVYIDNVSKLGDHQSNFRYICQRPVTSIGNSNIDVAQWLVGRSGEEKVSLDKHFLSGDMETWKLNDIQTEHRLKCNQTTLDTLTMQRNSMLQCNSNFSNLTRRLIETRPLEDLPWQIIRNPFNPSRNEVSFNNYTRCWQHCFPQARAASSVNWKSMCAPALLPVSTDYLPTENQILSGYDEYTYQISINPDEGVNDRKAMLLSMISQRLAHGFQIVLVPTANVVDDTIISRLTSNGRVGPLSDPESCIYLTLGGQQFHKLICDSTGYNIEVKRYVKKEIEFPQIHYKCLIWSDQQTGYKTYTTIFKNYNFSNENTDKVNWNYVDNTLSSLEYYSLLIASKWRTRFVFVPCEISLSTRNAAQGADALSDEELRLAGILKLVETFHKSRFITAAEKDEVKFNKKCDNDHPDVIFTTLKMSAFVNTEYESFLDVDSKFSNELENNALDKSINLNTLAQKIQGSHGVKLCDRRWHWKLYENTFIGHEMVDWLLENFKDINSRIEAVGFGNELQNQGVFEHVEKNHGFLDGHYFYSLSSQYSNARPSKGWFGTRKFNSSIVKIVDNQGINKSTGADIRPVIAGCSDNDKVALTTKQTPKKNCFFSKKTDLDLDKEGQSYRPEILQLHYDTVHNPEACYHILLEWSNVTARLIVQNLAFWARTASYHGLRMVEIPLAEANSINDANPFREPLTINVVRMPQSSKEVMSKLYYQEQILKKFNFYLDFEASTAFSDDVIVQYSWGKPSYRYPQYVHSSGASIVQVVDEQTFLWLTNRIFLAWTSATPYGSNILGIDADKLRDDFIRFCSNEQQLDSFYSESNPKLHVH